MEKFCVGILQNATELTLWKTGMLQMLWNLTQDLTSLFLLLTQENELKNIEEKAKKLT